VRRDTRAGQRQDQARVLVITLAQPPFEGQRIDLHGASRDLVDTGAEPVGEGEVRLRQLALAQRRRWRGTLCRLGCSRDGSADGGAAGEAGARTASGGGKDQSAATISAR